jgi:hypothetical protein
MSNVWLTTTTTLKGPNLMSVVIRYRIGYYITFLAMIGERGYNILKKRICPISDYCKGPNLMSVVISVPCFIVYSPDKMYMKRNRRGRWQWVEVCTIFCNALDIIIIINKIFCYCQKIFISIEGLLVLLISSTWLDIPQHHLHHYLLL